MLKSTTGYTKLIENENTKEQIKKAIYSLAEFYNNYDDCFFIFAWKIRKENSKQIQTDVYKTGIVKLQHFGIIAENFVSSIDQQFSDTLKCRK